MPWGSADERRHAAVARAPRPAALLGQPHGLGNARGGEGFLALELLAQGLELRLALVEDLELLLDRLLALLDLVLELGDLGAAVLRLLLELRPPFAALVLRLRHRLFDDVVRFLARLLAHRLRLGLRFLERGFELLLVRVEPDAEQAQHRAADGDRDGNQTHFHGVTLL
jgi:hypothetical protein